ncbi:MAG TPA: hypothetical protein VJN71_06215 [Nitrososphaerales archaeon]|nr:hypothetical protein [Nitrososphaerales archaeon]
MFFLSDLLESGTTGNICVKISSISPSLKSRSGWQYRKLGIHDKSMKAEVLISEEKYSQWDFRDGDCMICNVRSNGVDNEGKLAFFFNDFLGPFDSAEILFSLTSDMYNLSRKSTDKMKSSETVYQISAREVKSLLELIKLWSTEGKPQHYTKWCQMHQIVATNLYYMGLVKRTASMSGYYYPTSEALEFFEGKRNIPKKKVFVKDREGKHQFVSDGGDSKSFSEFLSDYADRESALSEYNEALLSYRSRTNHSNLPNPVN